MNKKIIGIILILSGVFILGYVLSLNQNDLKSIPEEKVNVSEKTEIAPTSSPQPSSTSKEIAKTKEISWNGYDEGLKLAQEQKKPVMMDFYADWCGYCVKMDKETYPDENVIAESERFITIKVDLTESDEKATAIAQKYNVQGFPTLIFIDSEGQWAKENSVIGFVKANKLLESMKQVK